MMIFGVPGYLVRKFELNNAAIVLALILGPLGEKGLHRSLLISDGNPVIFFESPVCIILIILCIFGILSPIFMAKLESKMQKSQTDEENISN